MNKLALLCAAAVLALAIGCGGGKSTEAAKTAAKQEEKKTEAPKTEAPKQDKPERTMWKVSGDTVTTASGLKYVVMAQGSGENAKKGETVTVHTTGWFTDGKKFYSSYDDGNPLVFPLAATPPRVIEGWEEGLLLMKKGSKYQLTCPPNLAYGERGRPPAIPPGSTLIFDVELLDIQPKQ